MQGSGISKQTQGTLQVTAAAGIYAACAGLVSFFGWAADWQRLTDWWGHGISIQPNTAIAALAAGAALLALTFGWSRAGALLGLFVGLIGATALFQHISGLNLGIDDLFLFDRPWGAGATMVSGRMGPPGATSFTLIGAAIVLAATAGRLRRYVPYLGLLVMANAMLSLIGYTLGAAAMFSRPNLTAIALQTATIIFVLGAGLVDAAPEHQPARLLRDRGPGGILLRRALPVVVLLPVGAAWLCLLGQKTIGYSHTFGTALLVLILIGVLVALLWLSARALDSRESAQRRAEDEKARLAAIVESSDDAIIGKSLDGIIQSWNSGAKRIFGYTAEQAIGQPITLIIPPDRWAEEKQILSRLCAGERIEHFETVRRRKDGRAIHVSLTISPIRDWSGRVVGASKISRDISEQKLAEEQLRERQERYELVVAGAEAAIWDWDVPARRVIFSPRWKQLRGLSEAEASDSEEEWIGRIHPDDLERVMAAVQAHFEGLTPVFAEEYRIQHKDGRWLWILSRGIARRDASGRVIRMAGSDTDITERKQAEQALVEAGRRKDEFLAMLAHELRNPLAPVRNALEMMKRAASDRAMVENARSMMERQVTHLSRLIDDLMDVSRITQGKLVLRKEKVNLSAVVRQAAEIARSACADKELQLRLVLPPHPPYVEGDSVRLEQIIGNLLNNACKYTDAGGLIEVRVQPEGKEVMVSVRDSGIGMTAEMLPSVFDMFTQGSGSLDRAAGGLGIGLALVRGLTKLHGGTVSASSAGEGKGSEFVIRLPALAGDADALPREDREKPSVAERPGRASALGSLRILVVDDNHDAASSLSMLLRLQGHQTQIAVDGEEVLTRARTFLPEVVLLDIGLPKMDGYEVCRALRRERTADQPVIIALTGWGQEKDRRRSQEAGFDAHLVKPAEYDALMHLLESLLKARSSNPAAVSEPDR